MSISKINTNSIAAGASPTMTDLTLSGSLFLGGTGSANELDDYEEGTWTPTLEGSTTNPVVNNIFGVDGFKGSYTKIGNIVYCRAGIRCSITTAGSGDAIIGGLPFAADTTDPDNAGITGSNFGEARGFNWLTTNVGAPDTSEIRTSSSVRLRRSNYGGSNQAASHSVCNIADYGSDCAVRIDIVYKTDS